MADDYRTFESSGGGTAARIDALLELTTELLALDDRKALARVLNAQRAADVADLIQRLDDGTREIVFGLLQDGLGVEVLAESDVFTTRAIAEDLKPETLSGLVEEMAPDDAADVLSDLEEEDAGEVLGLMASEEAREVQALMAHDEDSGGGLMTPRLVLADVSSTALEVIETLRQEAASAEILNLYVVNAEGKLQGVVPLHLLVTAPPAAAMGRLMDTDVISVTPETDQEDIARLFTRYDLVAMPVVDRGGRVIGQITVDDVMDVIIEEATEDIYKMAGTSDVEIERPSVVRVAFTRLPWLLMCLLGSFLAGLVIHRFEVTLERAITLASFIPVIMATGGNSGLQASTVTVRSLVTGRLSSGLMFKMVFREVGAGALIGLACGLAASAVAWLWFGQALVGICVGAAMFLVIGFSVLLGVITPIVFDRIGIDPAVASGPFITTANDVAGILIYLGLATLLLQTLL